MLPRISDDWWEENVIANLTDSQIRIIEERSYSKIEELDLAMLLRIANKSWYDMRTFAYLPTSDRDIVRAMVKVRNNWAHCSADIPAKEIIYDDIHTIKDFFENVILTNDYSKDIETFLSDLNDYNAASSSEGITRDTIVQEPIITPTSEIKELDKVYLVGEPDTKGMVYKVSEINNKKRYDVFVDGDIRPFYEGQIIKIDDTPKYRWVDINTFQSNITAYEINNPSAGNLYSLNAARIDFVSYQFRPALKLIKSDMPRILIADSVGVGKTIEAGLIIKELEARSELDNVLIICPKPLVAERKWELEMKRFDEEFTPLDGTALRKVISDTNRDVEQQDSEGMLRRALERIIQLYTDKSHFIYELLQNAEDAGATVIKFIQYDDRLEVLHNGKPFTVENLQGLCDIGKSDKGENLNQIGEFGVGFKSVFGICEVVKLYSVPEHYKGNDCPNTEPFAVEIIDFTHPKKIEQIELPTEYTTKFILPYCAGKTFSGFKTESDLRDTVAKRLSV